MGRNKDIRKRIDGYEQNIWKHRLKVGEELKKDFPDDGLLRKWRSEIKRDEERVESLNRRLERRRNYASHKKSGDVA